MLRYLSGDGRSILHPICIPPSPSPRSTSPPPPPPPHKIHICTQFISNFHVFSSLQDSVVRKVQGKDVVKQKKDEIRKERQKIARQDTFEKIKDYGKRKEVLENADTSYVHTTIPDVSLLPPIHIKPIFLSGYNFKECPLKLWLLIWNGCLATENYSRYYNYYNLLLHCPFSNSHLFKIENQYTIQYS